MLVPVSEGGALSRQVIRNDWTVGSPESSAEREEGQIQAAGGFLFYHHSDLTFLFLCFLKILFIFRERGREGEREGNIAVWSPLTCPLLVTWPAAQACALTGDPTSDPLVRRHSVH